MGTRYVKGYQLMPLPLKILSRLRSGRDLAAKVAPSCPENMAWIYIFPIVNQDHNPVFRGDNAERRVINFGTNNPIKKYFIRHLEINSHIANDFNHGLRDEIGVPYCDNRLTLSNEEELEDILQRWISDYSTLHIPMDVGYEFELGPDLIG